MTAERSDAPDYQAVYEANNVYEGTHYTMHPRAGVHEAHLNGIAAVVAAAQARVSERAPAIAPMQEDALERKLLLELVRHWREFGPGWGFDEKIESFYKAVNPPFVTLAPAAVPCVRVAPEVLASALNYIGHKKSCPPKASNFQKNQPCQCGHDAIVHAMRVALGRAK